MKIKVEQKLMNENKSGFSIVKFTFWMFWLFIGIGTFLYILRVLEGRA